MGAAKQYADTDKYEKKLYNMAATCIGSCFLLRFKIKRFIIQFYGIICL